jgi:hypothetical protein
MAAASYFPDQIRMPPRDVTEDEAGGLHFVFIQYIQKDLGVFLNAGRQRVPLRQFRDMLSFHGMEIIFHVYCKMCLHFSSLRGTALILVLLRILQHAKVIATATAMLRRFDDPSWI